MRAAKAPVAASVKGRTRSAGSRAQQTAAEDAGDQPRSRPRWRGRARPTPTVPSSLLTSGLAEREDHACREEDPDDPEDQRPDDGALGDEGQAGPRSSLTKPGESPRRRPTRRTRPSATMTRGRRSPASSAAATKNVTPSRSSARRTPPSASKPSHRGEDVEGGEHARHERPERQGAVGHEQVELVGLLQLRAVHDHRDRRVLARHEHRREALDDEGQGEQGGDVVRRTRCQMKSPPRATSVITIS